ncbi:MAG: hypothetical protein Q4D87_04985 [Actinomycetaceae bacterium]|nr:hypothetical protein [Actinomycetaceae bacterium]
MTSESVNSVDTEAQEVNAASRNLDKLLRETRRRLYAAAAAADYEMLGEVQSLPDSEIEAMERRLRGGLRSAELDHRRAVARLASADTPLPFADAANEFVTNTLKGRDIADPPARTQYTTGAGVDEQTRSDVFTKTMSQRGLTQLGFPKGLPVGDPPRITANAGEVILVIAENGRPEDGIDVATRLAARLNAPSKIVLAGARTVNPGPQSRARSAEELQEIRDENPDAVVILSVVNSSVASHQRNAGRIVSSIDSAQTWVVVDARGDAAHITRAATSLPGEVTPDILAVTHLWEARRPGVVLDPGVPVGLIDGAPASTALWSLIADDAYMRHVSNQMSNPPKEDSAAKE